MCRASQEVLVVKNPPANAGDAGLIPGQESPLEKEMAAHSSILAWKIPWTEETARLPSMVPQSHLTEHMHGRCHVSMAMKKKKRHHSWSRLWFKWACCLAMHPGRLWISVVGKYIIHCLRQIPAWIPQPRPIGFQNKTMPAAAERYTLPEKKSICPVPGPDWDWWPYLDHQVTMWPSLHIRTLTLTRSGKQSASNS